MKSLFFDLPPENTKLFLRSLPFFKGVFQEDLEALMEECSISDYKKDTPIIQQDDRAHQLFLILEGWIRTYCVNKSGLESGMMLLSAGNVFGADAVFNGDHYLYSATAETSVRLLKLPAASLRDIIKSNPGIASVIMHSLSDAIRERQISEIRAKRSSVTERVACLLLHLTAWATGKGVTFRFPYRKTIAAAQLGMEQATFSRTLPRLKEYGVVASKSSEIYIEDFATLSSHCCSNCPFANGKCKGQHFLQDKREALAELG